MEDMGIQIRYCAPSVCMSKTKNYLSFDSHTCYQNQYNYSRSLTNNMNKAITHNQVTTHRTNLILMTQNMV